ncbi:hypothetical protein GF323_02590 [Candidatus Woesearchaeota archaeon]|nr:hypothetical protein [Candidatus Woesearchaeota archaeon]
MADTHSLLEELFSLAGFRIQVNEKIGDYSVDLYAAKDMPDKAEDYVVLCKNVHEESSSSLKEDLQGFLGIKDKLKCDKLVIVIEDIEALGEDRAMAESHDILILEKDNLEDCLECARKQKKGINKFLEMLGISTYHDPNLDYNPVKPGF